MNYLVIDVESTIKNKGHPFTPENKLCVVGMAAEDSAEAFKIEYDDQPFGKQLQEIQKWIDLYDGPLVGFNFKFDLHWLRRYGINFTGCKVHDCQLAYFLLTHQKNRLPSLNEVAAHYGLGGKVDVVDEQYWSKGIDTPNVPWDVLVEYLYQDLWLTEQIYLRQLEEFKERPKLYNLFKLQCEDLLVLEEMEWNGVIYSKDASLRKADETDQQIAEIKRELSTLIGGTPVNWDSPEQVSAVLYGGSIKEIVREEFLFTYKDPKKEPVWKSRWAEKIHTMPRLCEPLPNSSLQKDGVFKTGESILLELLAKRGITKPAKRIIELLLSLAELSKLNDYYKGIPKLMEEMGWDGYLHGNLNQCNTITGRLSSNKPNLQNMPPEIQDLIGSRYA